MSMLKRFATVAHRWCGLTIGLAGCYLAVTGGWILLRPQGDTLLNSYLVSKGNCPSAVSFDRVLASARAAYKVSPIDSLWWKADPASTLMVRYHDEQQAYFDRCDGHLIGFHSRWAGAFGFVEKLHRLRFLPGTLANHIAGSFAIGMALAMGGLGLFIWWPRRRAAWKPALRLDPALTGRPRTRNRHSVVGAFVAPMLLLISVTGVVIGFDSVQAFIMTATGSKAIKKPEVAAPLSGQPLAIDAAWHNLLTLAGKTPRSASLKMPAGKAHAVEIYFNGADDPHREIRNYVYADPATGAVIAFEPYSKLPLGQRMYQWILGLHQGAVGGPIGQLTTLAAMLAILYLGYSGIKSYAQTWIGRAQPLRMRVAAVREEAKGVKSFDLVPVRAKRLPGIDAGAHITVHIPGGVRRQFSLINGPDERNLFRIAVRLEEMSRGGSRGMHALALDEEVLVGCPRNHFPIDRATRHATLIAAGIGITPLLSMAQHFAARRLPFVLHYFGREPDGMAFRDFLAAAPFAASVQCHVGLGRAAIPAELGRILANPAAGEHLYTCGPADFMAVVEEVAGDAGWPRKSVHRENFQAAKAMNGPSEPFELILARSGRTLTVASNESMLEALIAAGVPVASSCEQGSCGDCALKVCAGEIDHRDSFLSDAQRKNGNVILACVSRARKGSLTVDL